MSSILKKLSIDRDTSFKEVASRLLKSLSLEADCAMTALVLRFTNCLGWSPAVNHILRPAIFRAYGFRFGKGCCFYPGMSIYSRQDEVRVGDYTYINENCFFDATAPITIGNNCEIGFNVTFVTSSHTVESDFKKKRPCNPQPIVMEPYAWIGANATIMPGVTIGEGAVVAAGAVVTKNVEPHTVVAGIPAKRIRALRAVPGETGVSENDADPSEPENILARTS